MSDDSIKCVEYTIEPLKWKFWADEEISKLKLTCNTDFSGFGSPKVNTPDTRSEGWDG